MALEKGAQGVGVTVLQKSFNQLGVAKLDVDGNFGPNTFAAVETFQTVHSLPATGAVDEATYNAINNALAAQVSLIPTPWLTWMKSHSGETEQTGGPATDFDKEVFSHTSYGNLDGVMEAGCAATLCAALEESGFKSPHNASAESFRTFGNASALMPGAVIGFNWKGEKGVHCEHVAVLDHVVNSNLVACVGGNQSHQVKVSVFSRKFIDFIRFPTLKNDATGG